MFDSIKNWFLKRDIDALKNFKRKEPSSKPNVLSYDKIGILYEADERDLAAVDSFIKSLKSVHHSTVTTLTYKDDNAPQQETSPGVFYRNQINWYGIPKSTPIEEFTSTKFDVLFILSTTFPSHFLYILAKSEAKFKIGQNFEEGTQFLDLIIDIDRQSNVSTLIQNIIKIINKIATQK